MKHTLFLILLVFMVHFCHAQTNDVSTTPTTTKTKTTVKKSVKKKKSKKKKEKEEPAEKSKQREIKIKTAKMEKPLEKNGKKITGSISSVQGYRICIYSGSHQEEALQVKRAFMATSPKMNSYITYVRPYYRIKVGDFENKKIATKFLKKYIATYPNAFMVPDIVTVKNIVIEKSRKKTTLSEKKQNDKKVKKSRTSFSEKNN